jgi:hypothetical protein
MSIGVGQVMVGVTRRWKFAVTLCGAFIATVVEALVALAALPVQFVKP